MRRSWSCHRRNLVVVFTQIVIRVRRIHRMMMVGTVMSRLLGVGVFCCVLCRLLVLSSLHFGLFEQPSFLCQAASFLAVFDLILSNQCFGRLPKDRFVLAKLADPYVFRARRIVDVGVVLLDLTPPRCKCIHALPRPSGPLTGVIRWRPATRQRRPLLSANVGSCLRGKVARVH